MTKISSQPPSGFRDFTPNESAIRAYLMECIANTYTSYGFQQIFTSACENLSTLQGKGGGQDNEHLIFKIQKRGEALEKAFLEAKAQDLNSLSDLGLRFDLTLPLARYISRFRNELSNPFKVFQIGSVWRAERAQKGRYREFLQCDVDVVGSSGIGAEIDCISAITQVFHTLGLNNLELHLNDRRILAEIGSSLGISKEIWQECLITIDKLDKIGIDGIQKILSEKIPANSVEKIIAFITNESSFSEISKQFPNAEPTIQALKELFSVLQNTIGNKILVRFSPSLVRGQDYYTGTIFEIRHKDLSGSLAGGGRYDRLLELFGGSATPAFGGSIGFERLFLLLSENKEMKIPKRNIPILLFPLFQDSIREKISKIASTLRERGIACDVYPDSGRLKNQFKYAHLRGIPYVAILAENEIQQGKITLKEMASGTETMVAMDVFVNHMENICKKERIHAAN